jgi:tRNA G18 (ribose-2'-O)-methylase SpoU
VLLEDPRNLGNVGAVVRVAAGFGARAVWTTGSVDPWHPTVVRAAAGLHFAVAVERHVDGALAVGEQGSVLAFDSSGEDLREVSITDQSVLVFGSERRGLSPALRRRADRLVSIPMRAKVSSYNLATSVAVALFHWKSDGGAAADGS